MALNGWHRLFIACTSVYVLICIYIGYTKYPTIQYFEGQVRAEYMSNMKIAEEEIKTKHEAACKRKFSEDWSLLINNNDQIAGFMSKLADPNMPYSEKHAVIDSLRVKPAGVSAIEKVFAECMKQGRPQKLSATEDAVRELNEIAALIKMKTPALEDQQKQVIYMSAAGSILPPVLVYFLGLVIAWIARGFRQGKLKA